jgi:hypothetical protein
MIVKAIRVRNFRCLLDATLDCESLTALVGANGSGKSSLLRALELFYAGNLRVGAEDFYNGDDSKDIEITVTFTALREEARDKFAAYLENGDLSVTRVLALRQGKLTATFHGSRLQNPDFLAVRQAGAATPIREKYAELRRTPEYAELPAARSQAEVLEALKAWEDAHADRCTSQRDDGQFFGFTEVAQGYLGRFTRLISVPAVRDAAEDAAEGKGHAITEMLDLVVRSALANREDLQGLKSEAQAQYDAIMSPATLSEIGQLETSLTQTLTAYVPDARVELKWLTAGGIEVSLPRADVNLVEDGYSAAVERTGHGLQRAFILTMLQHLTAVQVRGSGAAVPEASDEESGEGSTERGVAPQGPTMPDLVLIIEEPELYQHPSRQRHLANVLLKLASGALPGVAERTQVIYATHSPLFVGIDRFNQLRVFRKVPNDPNTPKITRVVAVTGDSIAESLWKACDCKDKDGNDVAKFTWETLKPRLQAIMTPWTSEGFFADVVVLAEGEDDRAAILGTAQALGHDLESQGFAIIPCGGKSCLDRPALIFRGFGIPTYLLCDADKNVKEPRPHENHRLLRLVGADVKDWPSTVGPDHAFFENKLEDTLGSEIGAEVFEAILSECQEEYGIHKRDDALKHPFLFSELIRRAAARGHGSPTMQAIVAAILKLKAVA